MQIFKPQKLQKQTMKETKGLFFCRFSSLTRISGWGWGVSAARAHQIHSLSQVQCTVAQRAETTVAECFLTSCV